MMKKIKEKFIKWSRNAEKVEYFSMFITLILIVLFVPIALYDIGVVRRFSENTFKILLIVFKIWLCIGIVVLLIKNILSTINSKECKNDSNTNLLHIIFSNPSITEDIILSLLIATILLPFVHLKSFCYLIFAILYMILPKRVAKYFEEKLNI